MVPALTLWLPVLLSAVFVFIASSLIHMLLKYNTRDYRQLPAEDRLMEDLRKYAIEPGEYYMPYLTDMKERETDEYRKKLEQGPVGFMTITSPDYAMGKSLAQWFAYCLLVGFFTAYVAGLALEPGAGFTAVFRVVGTVALGGYFLALIQDSIWYQRSWATTARYLLDGFIYALGTAAIFAWLWP